MHYLSNVIPVSPGDSNLDSYLAAIPSQSFANSLHIGIVKGKGSSLDIVPLMILDSGTL